MVHVENCRICEQGLFRSQYVLREALSDLTAAGPSLILMMLATARALGLAFSCARSSRPGR